MLRVPARAIAAFPDLSNGNSAGRLITDMAIDIGENNAEGGHMPGLQGGVKLSRGFGSIHSQKSGQPSSFESPEPSEGHRTGIPGERRQDLIDNRTIPRRTNRLSH